MTKRLARSYWKRRNITLDKKLNQMNLDLIENDNRNKVISKYRKTLQNKQKFFEKVLEDKIKKENKLDISKSDEFLQKREELKTAQKYAMEISDKVNQDDIKLKKLSDKVF